MTNHPIFAYVLFPIIGNNYVLIIPFSDYLRAILNTLNSELVNMENPESVAKIEITGSFVLRTDLDKLNSYFEFNDMSLETHIQTTINEKGRGCVIKKFDPLEISPFSQSSSCLIEFFKNQTLIFGFSLGNGSEYKTEVLTLSGFNKLILESYQLSLDNNKLGL